MIFDEQNPILNAKLMNQLIGLALKEKRLKLGHSQGEVAQRLAMDIKDYRQLEMGSKFLDREYIENIWLKMGLNPNDLLNIGKVASVRYLMELYQEWDKSAEI